LFAGGGVWLQPQSVKTRVALSKEITRSSWLTALLFFIGHLKWLKTI
jgi:hypothetical protein